MPGPRQRSTAGPQKDSPTSVLRDLHRCSRPSVPPTQFYTGFLQSIVTALRATSACIWRQHSHGFQVVAHRNLEQTGLRSEGDAGASHQQLLANVLRDMKPARFRPEEVSSTGTNPLKLELFLIPYSATNGAQYIIEVFSAPATAGAVAPKKGRLARMNQLCAYFGDYLQSQELRMRAEYAEAEGAMRTFLSRINSAKTFRELSVVTVNEARQVIGCDRVSLGWIVDRQPRIISICGQDTVDTRSNVVRAMNRLTSVAIQTGKPLQTSFPREEATDSTTTTTSVAGQIKTREIEKPLEPIPAEFQSAIDDYPADERPVQLRVIPFGESLEPGKGEGALIVEHFQSEPLPQAAFPRADYISRQIAIPLHRLELMESIPLMSWWARPGRRKWNRGTWKWIAGILLVGLVGGLAAMPLDLRLPADGELIAETRYAVFAPENGIIREVLVEHGTRVKQGDPLLTLDNLELSSQLRELTGQLIQHRERQRTLEARRSVSRLTEREQIELQSGLVEAASAIEHTERQIKLMHERLERLKIVAPADGVITSWNVKQTLLNRTVLPGDSLLQEIEPNGKWLIELQIPEDRLGYVTRYRAGLSDGESLKVEFVLATEPERRYSGTLKSIGERTELIADIHAVRAVVELDANSPPPLRDGAEVKARLNCGPHRAGFVWFRELIEVIQTYWWY